MSEKYRKFMKQKRRRIGGGVMCVQKEGKKAKKNRLVYRFIAIYFSYVCMPYAHGHMYLYLFQ